MIKKCYTHKKFKTNIKSSISIVQRVFIFNQEAWLKPYIDLNTELRKMQKVISKEIFQVNK